MKNMRPSWLFVCILALLSMLLALAINMYLPAFLEIAKDLDVSQEKIQSSLAIFTFRFAIA
ncbi:hypothetical protein EV693_104104 [Nicoletella semolina]|uniref:MFS transporter n=1 Tax=Nicoletella semolina TaxID=271160 RepID=A0A4R2N9Y5_9PAST|nr:hypothetical protein [Nicoletella semolina]MDH2925395.1 hypothetical protein [Nicoletella semolina]TCP17873.1 hypothetical protein EV693_104104 [Nicoletella semolina]